jgi:PST family polysaccharide transporter
MQSAAMWTAVNSLVLRLAQFIVSVVTARIVAPTEFGVFAVALTVYTVVANVSELGASAALVRAKDDVDRMAPTVLTISLCSSGALTVLTFFSADWLAGVLGAPSAASAIRIMSFIVVLGGMSAVPYGLLVRSFRQDKRFIADVANFVVGAVTVIPLALNGLGADALALSRLGGHVVSVILLIILITPRYLPGWDRAMAGSVLRFSLPLAAASVIAFVLTNADYVVVGRLLGPLALGLYMLAFNIAGWPLSAFSLMVNEVALPAFAQIRDDREGLPARVAMVFSMGVAVALPVSVVCLGLAHPIVQVVYGPEWAGAAAVLMILGLFGSFRMIFNVLTIFLTAVGRSRQLLVVQLVWIGSLVPSLVLGVHLGGIVGAGIAQQLVVTLVVLPLLLWFVASAGGPRPLTLLRACRRPLVGALAATAALVPVLLFVEGDWPRLVLGGLAAGGAYLLIAGRWLLRQVRATRQTWDATGPQVAYAS